MMNYNHKKIEKKWQKYWEDNKSFKTINDYSKPKFYALDMFPYPSGSGLHVGCLLYTSDAADDLLCVDLGGRRIIKNKILYNNTIIKLTIANIK